MNRYKYTVYIMNNDIIEQTKISNSRNAKKHLIMALHKNISCNRVIVKEFNNKVSEVVYDKITDEIYYI